MSSAVRERVFSHCLRMMKRLRSAFLALSALAFADSSANAQVTTSINFNDGSIGGSIGSFYSAQGVTFLNADWGDYLGGQDGLGHKLPDGQSYPNSQSAWLFGCCSFHETGDIYTISPSTPILAVFSTAMQSVSLRGLDISFLGYRLSAYDYFDNLVASASIYGPQEGGVDNLLTVSGSGIYKIAISQNEAGIPGTDGITFDDLEFTTDSAPEPATLLLIGPALFGVGIFARRRAR